MFWLVKIIQICFKREVYSMSNFCVFLSDNWLYISTSPSLITDLTWTQVDVGVSSFQSILAKVFKLKSKTFQLDLLAENILQVPESTSSKSRSIKLHIQSLGVIVFTQGVARRPTGGVLWSQPKALGCPGACGLCTGWPLDFTSGFEAL